VSVVIQKSTLVDLFALVRHINANCAFTVIPRPCAFIPAALVDVTICKDDSAAAMARSLIEVALIHSLIVVAEDALLKEGYLTF